MSVLRRAKNTPTSECHNMPCSVEHCSEGCVGAKMIATNSTTIELTKLCTTCTYLRTNTGGENCRVGEEEEAIRSHGGVGRGESGRVVLEETF